MICKRNSLYQYVQPRISINKIKVITNNKQQVIIVIKW